MSIRGRLRALREKMKHTKHYNKSSDNPKDEARDMFLRAEVRIVQDQPNASQAQHQAAEREYWHEQLRLARRMNSITHAATVVGAITAIVGLIGLGFIWGTLKATWEQVRAESIQAEAAREALRANMVITTARKEIEFAPNAPIRVYMGWKNAGGSTASDVIMSNTVIICRSSEDQKECIRRELQKVRLFTAPSSGRGPIGAGVIGEIPIITAPQPFKDGEDLRDGIKVPYFIGAIRYRDVFSDRRTPQSCTEIMTCLYFERFTGRSALCPIGSYERQEPHCYDE